VSHFFQAAILGIQTSNPRRGIIQGLLASVRDQEKRTKELVQSAYSLCRAVCDNYHGLADGEQLLLLSLEIGFRLYPDESWAAVTLEHVQNYDLAAGVVFGTNDEEAIADLLCAWLIEGRSSAPHYSSLRAHAQRIISLHNRQFFSPRFRRTLIHAVRQIKRDVLLLAEAQLTALLDKLCVRVEDVEDRSDSRTLSRFSHFHSFSSKFEAPKHSFKS